MKSKIVACLLACLMLAEPGMAQITVPNVFTTSVPVSQLNGNFSTIAAGALNRANGTITGNITVNSGVTIDGVDISAVLGGTGTPTFSTLTLSSTSASALDVAGGINAGSGNVGIVDTTGKIPAISSTYFASLSGANLTGLAFSQLPTTWSGRTFSAGNYTANGSMTWTVEASDVGLDYSVEFGKTLLWTIYILTSTVGGTLNSELRVTLPNARTVSSTSGAAGSCASLDNSTEITAYYLAAAGESSVRIIKNFGQNWVASTNATYVACSFVIPIN